MSDYVKKTWADGEQITPEALNNIETGIVEAKKAAQQAENNANKKTEAHEKKKDNPHGVTLAQLGAIGFKRILTAADNLNTLTEEGNYYYSSASVPKNAPFTDDAIIKITKTDSDNDRVEQEGTRYGTTGEKKHRVLRGGSWQPWERILCYSNFVVGTVSQTASVEANKEHVSYIDATKDGFTPIGIVGYSVTGNVSTRANIKLLRISGNRVQFNVFNFANTETGEWTITAHVLYVANS